MTIDIVNPGTIRPFRYWCQKVLPAVYDDSLSYYELLAKVIDYLDEMIEIVNKQSKTIVELQTTLQQFLDMEVEPYIEEAVESWFEENEPEIVERINELIDYTIGSLNFSELNAYCRDTNLVDGNRSGAQGFTAFKNANGDIVSVVYVTYNNAQPGELRSYLNGTPVSAIECSLGHGSSIGYKDGFCYITDNQVTNTIYRASVTQVGVLGAPVAHIPAQGGNLSVNDTTGDVYLIGTNSVRKIDISTGTTLDMFVPNFHQPSGTLGQSAFAFDLMGKHLFGYLFSNPNCITLIDEDNNFYGVVYLPNFVSLINMGEVENLCIDKDGNIFLVFNSGESLTTMLRTYTMATGSIFGNVTFTPYDIPSSTYVNIEWWANDTSFKIPTKGGIAYYGSNAPIKVYYGEDVQSVIDYFQGAVASIILKADTGEGNGAHIRNFNGNFNFDNHIVSGDVTLDSCHCALRNCTNHIDAVDKTNKIVLRLGSHCDLFSTFTKQNGVIIGNSGITVPAAQTTSLIAHSANADYGIVKFQ